MQHLYKRSPGKISGQGLYKSSVGEISIRDLLARSLQQIYIRGLLARSLYETSVAAVYKSSLGKISVRDLLARSQQISMQCLRTRSLQEVSWQDLFQRSLRKLSIRPLWARFQQITDLYAMSLCKISIRGVLARSLHKLPKPALYKLPIRGVLAQDLLMRLLCKLSMRAPLARSQQISMRCLCTRSLQELSVQDLDKRSPWQDLCASSLVRTSLSRSLRKISLTTKMSTAPQRERERSDTPKVTRRLRERFPSHRFLRDFRQKRKMKELLCCTGHQKRRARMKPPRIDTRP